MAQRYQMVTVDTGNGDYVYEIFKGSRLICICYNYDHAKDYLDMINNVDDKRQKAGL